MLDVRRLVLLRDLAEYGTVTAVAELHQVTASAVSQQLRQLETEAGLALLHRSGRGVRLTEAAHGLVADTEDVLCALERASARLHQPAGEPTGPLRLACFASALAPLVAPALTALNDQHPALSPRIAEAEPEQALPALRQDRTDLAVVYRYTHLGTPAQRGVTTRHLFTEPLVLVLPDGHPAAATPVDLRALATADWVGAAEGTSCREATVRACGSAGFAPRVHHVCAGFPAMLALAAATGAVTLLPRLAAHDLPPGLTAHPIEAPGLGRAVEVAIRRGTEQRPAVAAGLRALTAAAAEPALTRCTQSPRQKPSPAPPVM